MGNGCVRVFITQPVSSFPLFFSRIFISLLPLSRISFPSVHTTSQVSRAFSSFLAITSLISVQIPLRILHLRITYNYYRKYPLNANGFTDFTAAPHTTLVFACHYKPCSVNALLVTVIKIG
jgi:hypothetical protein